MIGGLIILAGVLAITLAVFWHPWIALQPLRIRVLLTCLACCILGLGSYYVVWISHPNEGPPALNFSVNADASPHPGGTQIAGITWQPEYVDIRLDISNGETPIYNFDATVVLDVGMPNNAEMGRGNEAGMLIMNIGQLSRVPNFTAVRAQNVQVLTVQPDANANWLNSPPEQGRSAFASSHWRLHCDSLSGKAVLSLIIAGANLDAPTAKELLHPGKKFDYVPSPKRLPQSITVKGTVETRGPGGVKHYPVEFFEEIAKSNNRAG